MFVVNFDFREHIFPLKILAINIPVLFTELILYPLQRLQTLMISQPHSILNKGELRQINLTLKNMLAIEGYPKLLQGMRYSIDYMGTQMTIKFLTFDYLINNPIQQLKLDQKKRLILNCFIANIISTFISQISFNYQVISSSLPIDNKNKNQNLKTMLIKFTSKQKIPIHGLRYTIPISIINSTVQILILNYTANYLFGKTNLSYLLLDQLSAFFVFFITGFVSHFAFQRQVQICKGLPLHSIPYRRGLISSLLRYSTKGLLLFSFYMLYFQMKTKYQLQAVFQKRSHLLSQVSPSKKKQ